MGSKNFDLNIEEILENWEVHHGIREVISFTKKEHEHIAFFVDQLEPACDAFTDRRYGAMFEALGGPRRRCAVIRTRRGGTMP